MQAPDEENRAFKEGERIGGSVEESVQYQHPTPTSGASMVFSGIVIQKALTPFNALPNTRNGECKW